MTILESQIESSLPLTYDENGETRGYFTGQKKSLTIATNYSIWEGRRGYVIAEYMVRGDPSGKESLYVSERTIGAEAKTETVLLKDCDLIEFDYLEKGLTKEDTKWVEQWGTTETEPGTVDIVPGRIRVHVRYRTWDHSVVIPVRVGAAT